MKAFDPILYIKDLNILKKDTLNTLIKTSDLQQKIKKLGLPSSPNFWVEFKNSGLFITVKAGYITWVDSKPIHFTYLGEIYSNYHKKAIKYNKVTQLRKKTKKHENILEIQNAIKLLKDNGYEIFKCCDEFYKKV